MKTYYQGVETLNNKIEVSKFHHKVFEVRKIKKENWLSETGTFLVKR